MDEKFKREIVSCVEKSMQSEKFFKMNIDFTGTTTKGEGFMADLIFATVTETDKNNKYKKVDLAIKVGKRSEKLRENFPAVIDCYQREYFIYDTVLPTFHQFQLEKNIVNIFDAFPKCYEAVLSDDIEALVLENLKKRGFTLHDKQLTMNLQHLHLVLKNYAKLHALSFAFRDQHKEEFNKLTAGYYSVHKQILPQWVMAESNPRVLKVLRDTGRDDLAAKYVKETENNEFIKLLAVLDYVPRESVILHGDCHNNNFLFQYEGNNEETPLRVAILDWQLSGIHSPVLDLSYFLYSTASRKDLFQMDELLKFYHSHLTDFMKQLGSDAQKVFPYSTLVEHWGKYSIFGFVVGNFIVNVFFIPKDQTPVVSGDKAQFGWENMTFENEDLYKERLISNVDQYFNFRFA